MNLFYIVSNFFTPSVIHFGCYSGLVSLQLTDIIYSFLSSSDLVILFGFLFLPYWSHVFLFSWMFQRISILFSGSDNKVFAEFYSFSESLWWQILFFLCFNIFSFALCFFFLFVYSQRKYSPNGLCTGHYLYLNRFPMAFVLLTFFQISTYTSSPLRGFLWPPSLKWLSV